MKIIKSRLRRSQGLKVTKYLEIGVLKKYSENITKVEIWGGGLYGKKGRGARRVF